MSQNQTTPLRVGLAVLYLADRRALEATLRSLARLIEAPAETVVLEQPLGTRELPKMQRAGGPAVHAVSDLSDIRAAALERLSDCDLVVIIREGVVLAPTAITTERERFESRRDLAVALSTSRLTLDLDAYLAGDALADPYGALTKAGRARPSYASNYFAVCLLAIAPGRGPAPVFERFARRSDWAAARFLLDALDGRAVTTETTSDTFGLVGNFPDRRDSEEQGVGAMDELYRFKAAFPQHAGLVRAEVRRLWLEQLQGILVGSLVSARARFLRGMARAGRSNRRLRARISRDIANLG